MGGPTDDGAHLAGPGPMAEESIENSITIGRNGKGSIYVWASGNGKDSGDNCNYDGYANSRYTIAIGATGKDGKYASYSEPCAALIACSPSSDTLTRNYITTSKTGTSCETKFGGTSAACPMAAGVIALCFRS